MKSIFTLLLSLYCGLIAAQTTYYSRNTTSGGNWNNVNSWTLSSDGSGGPVATVPSRTDDIVVLNGHTITVANANANGSAATSPNAQYTVGAFVGNGTNRFYQNGLITINSGGILSFTAAAGAMLEDTIYVYGTLQTVGAGRDLINAGYFHTYAGSTLSVADDFILIDNSETILDNASVSADDIYMDGTSALLCGEGGLQVGDAIQEFNGADSDQQICDTFTVTCSDGDCNTGSGSGSQTGSGSFTLPVELVYFTASTKEASIELKWTTASELNNDFFTIEVSDNGKNFTEHIKIKGQGTTSEQTDYFIELNFSKSIFIRLSQTDFDGTSKTLGIRLAEYELNSIKQLIAYPIPANKFIKINSSLVSSIEIRDMSGRLIYSKESLPKEVIIDIKDWRKGIYTIKWTDASGKSDHEKILIQK